MGENEVSEVTNKTRFKFKFPKKKGLMDYFKDYCGYTGIHGFIYIGEDRTLLERIWWILSLILSIILCSMMIYEIFQKYINYPVLVTFSMQETRLQEIPFPAVTICPRAKFPQEIFNVTELILKNNTSDITIEELKTLDMASTVCDFYASGNESIDVEESEFYQFLNQGKFNVMEYCQYLGEELNCSEIFTPILTEDGICYSFNIMDKEDIFNDFVETKFPDFHKTSPTKHWSKEQGYTEAKVDVYPRRALRIGVKNAFMVVLKVHKSNVEYECAADESGYRVTLHQPSNIPEVPDDHFPLPLNQRINAVIIPRVMKTSKAVKVFSVSKRDCYFESERKLYFFKIYTQENCRIECKTNYTLASCGCVGFHMPKKPGTPICLLQKIECMEEAEYIFATYHEKMEIVRNGTENSIFNCDCRPSCNDISYDLEVSQNLMKYEPINKLYKTLYDNNCHYSIMNLYFKKNHIETKERNELYGFSDVISNFGGLLGLFTGFSILSFTEIIYFLSLRIWGNIRLYGNWWGQKDSEKS